MMPYCVGDPHSHCLTVQQRHPQFCGVATGTVEVPSARIDHATPVWFSWRWRIAAVFTLMATCTLVMLLTMESAVLDTSLPTSGRVDSFVLDQENSKSAGGRESDQFKDSDTLAASGGAEESRHLEVVLGNEKEYSVNQPQVQKREMRSRNNIIRSVLIKPKTINPPQVANPPLSHVVRRRPRIAGIDCLTFSNRRILADTICTNKDISIFQSPDGSSGIPRYAVQIMNNCMSDCPPSDIHVFCGWFASALLVNPNSFKRLAFNDCLVNGGKPLRHGETLRFTYANSFMYPLRFKSASFCK